MQYAIILLGLSAQYPICIFAIQITNTQYQPFSPSTQTTQDVPLFDPALVVLVTNSNFKHTLVDGEYKYRRDTCMDAARKLGKELLKDVSLEELESVLKVA